MITLKELLTQDSWNSRFIYLVTNLTVSVCVLALVAATILGGKPDNAIVLDAYIYMVGVLLSGGLAGAAGRWMTQKKPPVDSNMESTETTIVKETIVTPSNR